MRPPRGGLRPIHNRTHGVAKVDLRIAAGASLAVQDDVAEQLLATGDFAEGAAPAPLLDALDADHERRFPDVSSTPSADPAPTAVGAKRPPRKAKT